MANKKIDMRKVKQIFKFYGAGKSRRLRDTNLVWAYHSAIDAGRTKKKQNENGPTPIWHPWQGYTVCLHLPDQIP